MIPDAIHPSVIFHNNKYWMAYTPYSKWNTKEENPCLMVSEDGHFWNDACKNPIVQPPENGHHSDPFLFFDTNFKIVYNHYYLDGDGQEYTCLKLIESVNGKEWQEPRNILLVKGSTISPCVVDDRLWYIRVGVKVKGESKTPYGLFFIGNILQGEQVVTFGIPDYHIWHFEIRKQADRYAMLMSAYPVSKSSINCQLFYAESKDCREWVINPKPIIDSYKATLVNNRIWYAFLNDKNQWCINDIDLG